jgi:hypothetical protein
MKIRNIILSVATLLLVCLPSYSQYTPAPTVLNTTHDIYVDGNRTDTYVTNGSVQYPYKTIDAALSPTPTNAIAIHLTAGTYTENSDLTFPNVPITIYGNGATLNASGHNIVIQNPYYYRLNLYTTAASITFNNFTSGARCLIHGGGITGNVNVNSYCEFTQCQMNSGTVTVGSTGQCIVNLCSPTDTFVSTGILTLSKVNINTSYAGYLVTATAGQLVVSDSLIYNLNTGVGGDISCADGATTAPNMIANNVISTAGSGYCVSASSAYTVYSKNYVVGTNTVSGTALLPVSSDVVGAGNVMAMGSDATGDLYYRSSLGLLTRLGVGVYGAPLVSNGTLPGWSSSTNTTTDVWLNGQTSATPVGVNIHAPGGIGSNIAGAGLNIYGGASTGTGVGGGITFYTSPASGTSGATANTLVGVFKIDQYGHLSSTGNTSTPSIVLNSSYLSTLTKTTTCTDRSGTFTGLVSTQIGSAAGSTSVLIATVTFGHVYTTVPNIILTEYDTSSGSGGWPVIKNLTTSGFQIYQYVAYSNYYPVGGYVGVSYIIEQ